MKKNNFVERVSSKLDELFSYHEELMEDLPAEESFKKERLARRGIEKTIELIVDAVLGIALIIISEKRLEKPEDSRGTIKVLEKNKILSKELSAKMQDLVSFRNLLVHRYGKIDEDIEYSNIKENHGDIVLFIKAIENYLNR